MNRSNPFDFQEQGQATTSEGSSTETLWDLLLTNFPQTCTFSSTFDTYYSNFDATPWTRTTHIGIDPDGQYIAWRQPQPDGQLWSQERLSQPPTLVVGGRLDPELATGLLHSTPSVRNVTKLLMRKFGSGSNDEVVVAGEGESTSTLELELARRGATLKVELRNILNLDWSSDKAIFTKSVVQAGTRHAGLGIEFDVTTQDTRDALIEVRMHKMRELHAVVAGRVTRPIETWIEQEVLIKKGAGVLISALKAGEFVGAAFFFVSGSSSYYASGVSVRALHDDQIGHGLISAGVRVLRQQSIPYLDVGIVNSTDTNSQKDRGIQKFKSLFRGTVSALRRYSEGQIGTPS